MKKRALAVMGFVTAVLPLALAVPASARPPQHVSDVATVSEPVENFTCPDGSRVLSTFTVERRVTTYFAASDEPRREVRQIRYEGVLYAEDLSRSIPYAGRSHRVFDFDGLTITITGRSAYSPLPGASTTGRRVIDVESDQIASESGRPNAAFEGAVCDYLYPGS